MSEEGHRWNDVKYHAGAGYMLAVGIERKNTPGRQARNWAFREECEPYLGP